MSEAIEYTMDVTFGRKKQVAPYEMAEASVTLSQKFTGDTDPQDIATTMQDMFVAAKSEVLLQLGLPFEQDEDTLRIMEVFGPETTVVANAARAVPVAVQPTTPVPSGTVTALPSRDEGTGQDNWPQGAVVGTGIDAKSPRDRDFLDEMQDPSNWWNNRNNKKNPSSPDFSHKTRTKPGSDFKVGLWLKDAPDWFVPPRG